MAELRVVDVTRVNPRNIVVIVNKDVRYLLQRRQPDTRWHVMAMENIGNYWNPCSTVIDICAYSNDIIEKIQLDLY